MVELDTRRFACFMTNPETNNTLFISYHAKLEDAILYRESLPDKMLYAVYEYMSRQLFGYQSYKATMYQLLCTCETEHTPMEHAYLFDEIPEVWFFKSW